jgi:hypothetical protein
MIGLGFLVALGPAFTMMAVGALLFWALTRGPRNRGG